MELSRTHQQRYKIPTGAVLFDPRGPRGLPARSLSRSQRGESISRIISGGGCCISEFTARPKALGRGVPRSAPRAEPIFVRASAVICFSPLGGSNGPRCRDYRRRTWQSSSSALARRTISGCRNNHFTGIHIYIYINTHLTLRRSRRARLTSAACKLPFIFLLLVFSRTGSPHWRETATSICGEQFDSRAAVSCVLEGESRVWAFLASPYTYSLLYSRTPLGHIERTDPSAGRTFANALVSKLAVKLTDGSPSETSRGTSLGGDGGSPSTLEYIALVLPGQP